MIEACVVGASVAAKWVLDEPGSDHAARLRGARLLAPAVFDVECAAILWKAMRRGEITMAEAIERQSLLADAPVERLSDSSLLPAAMRIAAGLDHPVYDCLYVQAALAAGVPLVTADRRLSRLRWPEVTIISLESLV